MRELHPKDVSPRSPLRLSARTSFVVASPHPEGGATLHSQHRCERSAQAVRLRNYRGKPEVVVYRVARGDE